MSNEEAEKTAGQAVYGPLLENLLTNERTRKSSLEQRGGAVITTSGVLVSLLFGIVAVVTNASGFTLPGSSRVFLVLALVLFVLAAVGGIIINRPLPYLQIHHEDLRRVVDAEENWNATSEIAARRVAEVQVSILERARQHNRSKARWLRRAMSLQILAAVALAISVTIMLFETN
jgi:hypothetical protein